SEGDVSGERGVEQLYDERLQPDSGYEIGITDNSGNVIETLFSKEAEDGSDIVLTIDSGLEEIINRESDEDSGSKEALDADNGAKHTTVSYPSPSPYDVMFGISQNDLEELQNDDENPLVGKFNRTTSPGSTQKILSALVALNTDGFDRNATREITGKSWQK